MGEDEPFDLGLLRQLADQGGRRMTGVEGRGRPGRIEHRAVEHQHVGIVGQHGEVGQPRRVDVPREREGVPLVLDPIGGRRRVAVARRDGTDLQAALADQFQTRRPEVRGEIERGDVLRGAKGLLVGEGPPGSNSGCMKRVVAG